VQSNQGGNEIRRDSLKVNVKLTNGEIASQEFLVNAPKEAHEVPNKRPHAFNGIDMNFTDAVTIVIACPFFLSMTTV